MFRDAIGAWGLPRRTGLKPRTRAAARIGRAGKGKPRLCEGGRNARDQRVWHFDLSDENTGRG